MDSDNTVVRDFNKSSEQVKAKGISRYAPLMFVTTMLVLGVLSGMFLYSTSSSSFGGGTKNKMVKTEKSVGSADKETFADSATGVLREGGADGEGTHHLEREGGPSQNVYLTSSVLDLAQFKDKEVTVWGETFSAEKAGWLMDVGLLEFKE